jgi:thiol-disulfide isomerase/thioredoxin
MTRFDVNVVGFILLLGVVGGLYRLAHEPTIRSLPNVASIASSSKESVPFSLLEKPRQLPMLRFANGSGAALTLADFHGKVVLFNIWATWCAPCRKEMPTLDRLQAKLGGDGFEVVALSLDQGGAATVRAFYDQIGIHRLDIYVDTSGYVVRDLNLIGVPTTFLVDRVGREMARAIGPAEWDSPEIVSLIKRVIVGSTTARGGDSETASQSAGSFWQRMVARPASLDVNRMGHGQGMILS